MALAEEITGSSDLLMEPQMEVSGIKFIDLQFFEFLRSKYDYDLDYSWNEDKITLSIKTDAHVKASLAKQLIESLDCACKEIYQLEEEHIKKADEFVNEWNSFDRDKNVFVYRQKHEFNIMTLQDHSDIFRECKRMFEFKVFKKCCYTTFERIEIIVINESLENFDDVCAIVNPTDEKFGQKGQVSRILSKRGGELYVKDCKTLRLSKEPTQKKCFVTRLGNLEGKKILHVVCPNIEGEKSHHKIQTTVFEIIYNCLKEAERKSIDTVAIPLIYTGRGKVSVDKCALPYAQAVLQFSMERANSFSVNTIYFIDTDEEKIKVLISYFDMLLPRTVLQLFEIPTYENVHIRKRALQAKQNVNESLKQEEENDKLKTFSHEHKFERTSCYDNRLETSGSETQDKSLTSKKRLVSTTSSNYEEIEGMKYADDSDSESGVDDENMQIDRKIEYSQYDCIDTVDENSARKENESTTLTPIVDRTKCKSERVETLKSGLKIIHTTCDADTVFSDTELNQRTIQSNTQRSIIGLFKQENEILKYSCANIQNIKQTTSSCTAIVDKTIANEKKIGADQYETLQDQGKFNEYDTIENETENNRGMVNNTQEKAGNLSIIHESNSDSSGEVNNTVRQDAKIGKPFQGYVDVHQNISTQCDDVVNNENQSLIMVKNIETELSIIVIGEHMDHEEENNKIDKKDSRLLEEENQPFHGHQSNIEKVGTNRENVELDSDLSCDKPYCRINVEKGSCDHTYYNIGNDIRSEVLPACDLGQVVYSLIPEEAELNQLKDNYETNLSEDHVVRIYKGDIRVANSGVIICPELPNSKYGGLIAVAIKSALRKVVNIEIPRKLMKSNGNKIATTNCRLKGNANNLQDSSVSFIYHVQTPIYKTVKDEETLIRCIDRIFRKLKKHRRRKITKLYIPLLGIEDVSNEDNVKTCCRIFVRSIHANCTSYKPPVQLMLVNRCKRITDMLINEMITLVGPSE